MAGLAALAAGALTKVTARVAEATDNSALLVGQTNSATLTTTLDRNSAEPNRPGLVVQNNNFDAIQGVSSGSLAYGVFGDNAAGYGVVGTSGSGVGVSGGSSSNTGVSGDSGSGTGVAGFSDTGPGVFGQSTAASSTQPGVAGLGVGNPGVKGTATGASGVVGTSTSGHGVFGSATSGPGVGGSSSSSQGVSGVSSTSSGVYGASTSGYGVYGNTNGTVGGEAIAVYGYTTTGRGVQGQTTGASQIGVLGTGSGSGGYGVYAKAEGTGGTGVYGYANDSGGGAVYGYNANSSGKAAQFDGNVQINGNYTATGTKSAAVPHPDGLLRRLYCQESPEPWFEDFGTGTLTGGRATVTLDPEFAAVVATDSYRVFLTAEGDCKGLYVGTKTPTGFEVREMQGGTSGLTFSYRVVARRKDIPGPRLERVAPTPRRPDPTAGERPSSPPLLPAAQPDGAVPAPIQAPSRDQRRGTPSSEPRR